MLWTRMFMRKQYKLDPTIKSRDYPKETHNFLKYAMLAVATLGLLCALNLPVQKQIREMNVEKLNLQEVLSQSFSGEKDVRLPKLLELPAVIEQCRGFFQDHQNQVLSVNLERLGEDSMEASGLEQGTGASLPLSLNYAWVQFKLSGSWNGIEESMQQIENLSEQAIRFQEVHLTPEGGNVGMKIYFYEPDNPPLP